MTTPTNFGRLGPLTLLIVSLGFVSSAWAVTDLEDVLGEIQWGDSKSTVLEKLKTKKVDEIRSKRKYRNNRVAMQKARQRAIKDVEQTQKSYQKLEGEKTGYEVSVIAGEFTRNNNEAVMRDQDEKAQKYYFFHDGAFYKLLVAYKQEYVHDIPFDRFVKSVAQKYGNPDDVEKNGAGELAAASWKGRKTTLRVENQMQFFGNYVMVFADRQKVERMKKKGKKLGGRKKDADQISDRIQKVKQGSDEDPNENVVDDMVGEDVEVDFGRDKSLEEERPDSEQEEFADKESKTEDDDGEEEEKGGDGEQDQAEQASASQPSSGSSGGGQESSSSSDGGGEEESGDDDLVIY